MANYGSYAGIQGIFGSQQTNTNSQLNQNMTGADMTRVQAALDYADSEINQYVGGVLSIPLPAGPTVAYMANVIAGCWLYSSRGWLDNAKDKSANKYGPLLRAVYEDLDNYVNGIKRFPGGASAASQAPFVV